MIQMLTMRGDRKKVPTVRRYRTMTEEEIRALHVGARVLTCDHNGQVAYVRVNGKPRTWKRQPGRLEIPFKYGMYECRAWTLPEMLDKLLVALD